MSDPDNPMGREYTREEIAAAKRVGIARMGPSEVDGRGKVLGGRMIWASGPYWPDHARKMAADWALVSAALDREWAKGVSDA